MTTPPSHARRSVFATVFLSPHEPRLRAGWRLVFQSLLMLVMLLAASLAIIPAMLLTGSKGIELLQTSLLLNATISLVGIVSSVWIARKFIDRRSFSSLGLSFGPLAIRDLVAGIGITAMMMGLVLALELAAGWTRFEGWAWQTAPMRDVVFDLLTGLAIFIAVGFYEEILYRGYLLQNLKDGAGLVTAILLSSVIFAASHTMNPNSIWYSTLPGILFAALFLTYGWFRSGALWLPIGLHIGWNLFEGPIFGFPVRGLDTGRLLAHSITGPTLWTGGDFGPEAGLIILPAIAVGSGLVWAYTRRRPKPAHLPVQTPQSPEL
jgi:membrane protease YdiL (CAAX protease family)